MLCYCLWFFNYYANYDKIAFLKGNNHTAFSPNAGSRFWSTFLGHLHIRPLQLTEKFGASSPKFPPFGCFGLILLTLLAEIERFFKRDQILAFFGCFLAPKHFAFVRFCPILYQHVQKIPPNKNHPHYALL